MPSFIGNSATLVTKLLIYAGFAQAVAIPFIAILCRFNQSILNQLKKISYISLLFALMAIIAYFFIQVAVFAEDGLSGAFEPFYIKLIWQSGVGEMTVWRIAAVIMALLNLTLVYRHSHNPRPWLKVLSIVMYAAVLVMMAYSFSASGHVSELTGLAHFAIGLHVIVALGWLGSLWPLIIICRIFNKQAVARIMHRFGQSAMFMVALLIVAGGYLAFNLIDDFNALANTHYGQLFSLKLILVFYILLLAAFHKFILVPGLLKARKARQSLVGSMKAELIIGLAILVVTAILTTWVGPTSH